MQEDAPLPIGAEYLDHSFTVVQQGEDEDGND
jgi:hypothetical protein